MPPNPDSHDLPDPDCLCGVWPYINGALCPTCFHVWIKERGSKTLAELTAALAALPDREAKTLFDRFMVNRKVKPETP